MRCSTAPSVLLPAQAHRSHAGGRDVMALQQQLGMAGSGSGLGTASLGTAAASSRRLDSVLHRRLQLHNACGKARTAGCCAPFAALRQRADFNAGARC